MLPPLGLVCRRLHRQLEAAGRAATNAGKGPKIGRGHLPSPHVSPPRQEPASGAAQGDGAPLGGLLLQPGAPPCGHVQGFQHGSHLLSGQR